MNRAIQAPITKEGGLMANRLTHLNVDWVSLVDRAAVRDPHNPTEPQRFLVWKSQGPRTHPNTEGGPVADSIEDVRAALAKAEQERDEAREATRKAQNDLELEKAARAADGQFKDGKKTDDDDDDDADDLSKADLPPAVRARLEKAESEAAQLRKSAQEAHEIAKAEREIRITREYVAKAHEYRALPIDAQVFGPVLKSAAEKLTKDEAAELERVLKAADEQIAASGLFKEHGRSGEPTADSPDRSLTQKAEEIRKSDPTMSQSKALERAIRENPQLAESYLASIR